MGIIMQKITVCALYKFVRLENFEQLKSPLLTVMLANDVKGTLLLYLNRVLLMSQYMVSRFYLRILELLHEIRVSQSRHSCSQPDT